MTGTSVWVKAASRITLAIALCVLCSAPAVAQEGEGFSEVEKLYTQGATHFNRGQFSDALVKFQEAYKVYPAPNLLFNMARCYQALGQMDLAVTTYQRFTAQPGIDAATKQQAEKKIEEIEAAVKETGGARRTTAAAGTAAGAQKEPLSFSPWQYVLLGVGGAAIIGGGVAMGLGFAKASDADNRRKDENLPATEYDALISDADTMKAIGYAMLGVGGALAITGAVLWIIEAMDAQGDAETAEEPEVAFMPAALQGGGGLMVMGRF